MSLSLPNQVARHLWLLLALLVAFYCDSSDADWCNVTRLVSQEMDKPCNTAYLDLVLNNWNLNAQETRQNNSWLNLDDDELAMKVYQGKGHCFLKRETEEMVSGCCNKFKGPDCEIPVCEPPCVNGSCTMDHVCQCQVGLTGNACDEKEDQVTETLKYCFVDEFCAGRKVGVAQLTSEQDCCDAMGGLAWGTSYDANDCNACVQPGNYTVVPSNPSQRYRTCMAAADCRYRTFDSVAYEYCSTCTVTMISSSKVIVTAATECDPVDECACIRMVTIKILTPAPGYRVVFFKGVLSLYDSTLESQTEAVKTLNTSTLTKTEKFTELVDVNLIADSVYIVMTTFGLKLRVDTDAMLFVTLEDTHTLGELAGMCGNYDGDYSDEVQYSMNKNEAKKLGQSFTTKPCGTILPDCITEEETAAARHACRVIESRTFEKCHTEADTDEEYYMDYCMRSYCASNRVGPENAEKALCNAVGVYAADCAKYIVVHWRTNDFCGRECPAQMTYRQCGTMCQRACGKHLQAYLHDECMDCVPGCHCQNGLLYQNGTCVPPNECGCVYNGRFYDQGETMSTRDGCQSCSCEQFGLWSCNETACSSSCSVTGQGFLNTFDGENFFLGTLKQSCAFKLIESTERQFKVSLLTKRCPKVVGLSQFGVCISGLQVEEEGGHTFRVETSDNGTVTVSDSTLGQSLAMPHHSGPFLFKDVADNVVVVDMDDLRVVFYPNGFVHVDADVGEYYNSLRGLCGNLNLLGNDERQMENGAQASSDEDFINAYSFVPDKPFETCGTEQSVPPVSTPVPPICEQLKSLHQNHGQTQLMPSGAVENMCHNSPRPETVCPLVLRLADTLGMSLDDLLPAGTTFTLLRQECVTTIPSCSSGREYRADVEICNSFCRDKLYVGSCLPGTVQGCACPTPLLRTDDGQCRPLAECTCYERTRDKVYQAGEIQSGRCSRCECHEAVLNCTTTECEEIVCPFGMEVVEDITPEVGQCQRLMCPQPYSVRNQCAEKIFPERKCFCPVGKVEDHTGQCIEQGTCPCYHKKTWHQQGSTIAESCFEKTCYNAAWNVTGETNCSAVCTMSGTETRYMTFDGYSFSFPGTCTYVLVHSIQEHQALTITTTNVLCGADGTSCTRMVEIEYSGLTIRLARGQGVSVGNVTYSEDQAMSLGDTISILPTTLFTVVSIEGMSISWNRGLFLSIRATSYWQGKLEGLCGNFDKNSFNDRTNEDGVTASDDIAFGNSWKVTDQVCSDVEGPLPPRPCEQVPDRKTWASKMCEVISTSEEFSLCRAYLTESVVTAFYDNCVQDGCACSNGGDCECLCDAIAAFHDHCCSFGYCVRWRHQHQCPVQCDYGKVYKACGDPVQPTCQNPTPSSGQSNTTVVGCVEGCFCPEGYVLHGFRCIPLERCPCLEDNFSYDEGTVITRYCQTCMCINRTFVCEGEICKPNCTEDQFVCNTSGQCLDHSYVCNNVIDCPDGSDEDDCEVTECEDQEFECESDTDVVKCIPAYRICDGIVDCADGSDESYFNCHNCTDDQFKCDSGMCLDKEYVCDEYYDCADGEDELECEVCPKNYTFCDNKACIPKNATCDGVDDCGDGSDEVGCTTPTRKYAFVLLILWIFVSLKTVQNCSQYSFILS
ncbi:SCO-spondin-like [Babylonia areolata]|uniref:SCO-spondin-like n=1 Tax=Babylonia areolata TaxID=304850 RepID=UPI003FD306A7